MAMTDPIADLLTRIRNAVKENIKSVECSHSNIKESIVKILLEEGYISGYKVEAIKDSPKKMINIKLKYVDDKSVITNLKRMSKPGLKVYVKKTDIPLVLNGLGTSILSTSKGIMTGKNCRKHNLGGELIALIY